MRTTANTNFSAGHAAVENPIMRRIASLVEGIRVLRARARALTELTRMSDAELADIGLVRADLHQIFRR